MKFITILFFIATINSLSFTNNKEVADRIYINAKVWTGNPAQPWTAAIAIRGNKIIWTGIDYQEYKGTGTNIIDCKQMMIVPGFIDNHTHFLTGGYNLASVNLRAAKTKQEFIDILGKFCRSKNDDTWVLGGDWDHEAWGGELPQKEWIDSVTGNHPVFVSRYDGHMAFANTIALKRAAVSEQSSTPPGGEIIKNKSGRLTGVLKDEAQELIFKVVPSPSTKQLDEYFHRAVQHAIENGVTQVHDVGSYGGWAELDCYRRARDGGQLPLRIYSFVPLSSWQRLDAYCKKNGKGDDMLRWGSLKGFVDGSLGSTTGWFYKPYLDAPGSTGLMVTDTAALRSWVLAADAAGLHIAVHAIGDRANDFILDVFEQAGRSNPGAEHRFRVEHAQHLSPGAIPRFAKLHVIPSMQPYHAIDDGRWAAKRLEDERLKGTYAFHSLLEAGATLSFGSDWTVAPLSPLQGIYAAVTRSTLDGRNPGGWYPEQKISVEAAIRCYTANNAFAGFQEDRLGVIKAGMLADFVVLNENLFEVAPENISSVRVMRTIINGKEVFTYDQKTD